MKQKTILTLILFLFIYAYSEEKLPILENKLEKFNMKPTYDLGMKYNPIINNKTNINNRFLNNKKDINFNMDVKLNEERNSIDNFMIGIDTKFKGIN